MDWFRFTMLSVATLAALAMISVIVIDCYFGAEWPTRSEDAEDGP